MVNLIKDVRKEWNAPQLPVSIAVSGFDGFYDEESTREPKVQTLTHHYPEILSINTV
jgi:hypothetical protein